MSKITRNRLDNAVNRGSVLGMSDYREQLAHALDVALIESTKRWAEIDKAEREQHVRRDEVQRYDVEAQRLQLALFQIAGEHHKNAGDANVATCKRKKELREES